MARNKNKAHDANGKSDHNQNNINNLSSNSRRGRQQQQQQHDDEHNNTKQYVLNMSLTFIICWLISSIGFSFGVGCLARYFLLRHESPSLPAEQLSTTTTTRERIDNDDGNLPLPVLLEGKELPRSIYTSKNFDTTASSVASSILLQKPKDYNPPKKEDEKIPPSEKTNDDDQTCPNDSSQCPLPSPPSTDPHLPAGQHLLVDIKNLSPSFLNSRERLATAMIDVVNRSKLTLLSYHCHRLEPVGVSCAGVLLESHVTFHTWPKEGVITLDLFTCGEESVLPVLESLVRLFGVGRGGGEEVEYVWAHKLRGFREGGSHLGRDLGGVIGSMAHDLKEKVATTSFADRRLDIYDIIDPRTQTLSSYRHSLLSHNSSYESTHPTLFHPNRHIFSQGRLQGTTRSDEADHESLVHPGMFAHDNPRRVGVLGDSKGAVSREVLKHNTVERVVVVGVDEWLRRFYEVNVPKWGDCGGVKCAEDERVDEFYGDAKGWFLRRFLEGSKVKAEKFDVLILDAINPLIDDGFANVLLTDTSLLKAVNNSIADDGIMVWPLGRSPDSSFQKSVIERLTHLKVMTLLEKELRVKRFHLYEESHTSFDGPRSFIVACKSKNCNINWYDNTAQTTISIHRRITPYSSSSPPLRHFDAATMASYRIPHRVYETTFCDQRPTPYECDIIGTHKKMINFPASSFEVKSSSIGHGGRGVFAKVDIPKASVLLRESALLAVYFSARMHRMMSELLEKPGGGGLVPVVTYMSGYGYEGEDLGGTDSKESSDHRKEYYVDASLNTFVNHGCNDTFNIGGIDEFYCMNIPHCVFLTEQMEAQTLAKYHFPELVSLDTPLYRRHRFVFLTGFDVTLRDVRRGEEIFHNYLYFEQNPEDLVGVGEEMRRMCNGEVGEVSAYEDSGDSDDDDDDSNDDEDDEEDGQ